MKSTLRIKLQLSTFAAALILTSGAFAQNPNHKPHPVPQRPISTPRPVQGSNQTARPATQRRSARIIPAAARRVKEGTTRNWVEGVPYPLGGDDGALNAAVDEINQAFTQGNAGLMGNLISNDQEVGVFAGFNYAFHLDAGEFQAMLNDTIGSQQTTSFQILAIFKLGNGAIVTANRTTQGEDGSAVPSIQGFFLERDASGGFHIDDYMNSNLDTSTEEPAQEEEAAPAEESN